MTDDPIYMRLSLDSFQLSPITCELLVRCRLAIFIKKVYNTDMKPRAHRVCTFSRLFSDFQNSLALRNTTESSLTEGRSCFALRLIGQDKEMSVFFPHLSKAEHVRQTKNIREIHAFHASLPPARPSTGDSQDVRTLVHLTTPAPIPCPACIWVKAESVSRMFFAVRNLLTRGWRLRRK